MDSSHCLHKLIIIIISKELRAKLEAARDAAGSLKTQLSDSEVNRRAMENQLLGLKEELDNTTRAKDDAKRDAYRYKSNAEVVGRWPLTR